MRWERLFDDLEAQLDAQARLELDAEVADRTRAERARVTLSDRLVGAMGSPLSVRLRGGAVVGGLLQDTGEGWLLLEEGARSVLVATPAVTAVHGLPRVARDSTRARRFGLGYALRVISRDRRAVVLTDIDGGTAHGTIDVVGADVLDLAEHPLDAPRRAADVQGVRSVPFAALACLASTT